MDNQEGDSNISLEKERRDAKYFGVIALSCLVFFAVVAHSWSGIVGRVFAGLASLTLVCGFAAFVFHGATVIALILKGSARRNFQIAVSVLVPLILCLFFIHKAKDPTFDSTFGTCFTWWNLLRVVLFGYISFKVADLDRELPFRGFLIAAAIFFGLSLYGYAKDTYSGEELEALAAANGVYLGPYLLNSAVVYTALFLRLARQKRDAGRC